MKLGKRQVETLAFLGRPTKALVVADKQARRLAEMGLLESISDTPDRMLVVTPTGLRMIADLMEAGVIERPNISIYRGEGEAK